jgi:hypothetical protein
MTDDCTRIGGRFQANRFDWEEQAKRLDEARRYNEAGSTWRQAASTLSWTDWCEAAESFALADGNADATILGRKTETEISQEIVT